MKKVLKDKENEISKSKKQLHWAREDAIKEYRDSDALLAELGGSFADGFDDCLHQVKASFLDLDLSHTTINGEGQTPACYVESEGTDDVNPDMSTLTLKVMKRPLKLIKKNPSRMISVNLKWFRRLRKRRKRPP